MKNLTRIGLIALIALVAVISHAQTADAQEPALFQTRLDADSQPVSSDLALLIAKSTHIHYRELVRHAPLGQWFRAVPISLKGDSETDLFVWGRRVWLTGADNDWFWIVRTGERPKVLLYAPGSLTLEILDTKTNGYPDLQTMWESPNDKSERIYRFARGKYSLRSEKWSDSDFMRDLRHAQPPS